MSYLNIKRALVKTNRHTPKNRWMFNSGWTIAISGISRCRQNNTVKIRAKRKRIVFQRTFQKEHLKNNWLDSHYCKLAPRFNDPVWLGIMGE